MKGIQIISMIVLLGVGSAAGIYGTRGVEHYRSLQQDLSATRQKSATLHGEVEKLAAERKRFENEQLGLAQRIAEQEGRLQVLEKEKTGFLETIERVTKTNKELVTQETEFATAKKKLEKLEKDFEAERAKEKKYQSEIDLLKKQAEDAKKDLDAGSKPGMTNGGVKGAMNGAPASPVILSEAKDLGSEILRSQKPLPQDDKDVDAARLPARQGAGPGMTRKENPADTLETLQQELEALRSDRVREQSTYFYNMGVLLTRSGMYREAVKHFEKAIEINPKDSQAHYNLAILYDTHLADHKKSMEHIERFMQLSPDPKAKDRVKQWILNGIQDFSPITHTPLQSAREALKSFAFAPTRK